MLNQIYTNELTKKIYEELKTLYNKKLLAQNNDSFYKQYIEGSNEFQIEQVN